MEKYIKRIADELLKDQLEASGAVLIEGPKWCGKTTTGENVAKSIVKLDDPLSGQRSIELANTDASLLLSNKTPLLIDEWQLAPILWNAVRYEVDKRSEMGQFILTGSSTPKKLDSTMHSGTGRIARVKMRPMSLYESMDSNGGVSLSDLFNGESAKSICDNISLNKLAYLICRGGWPQTISKSEKVALRQARNYYDAVLNQDLFKYEDEVKLDPNRANRVLRSYARNIGQSVSLEQIRNDCINNDNESFSQGTLYSYLNFLNRIFVLEDSLAWSTNLRSKTAIRTTDTRYFCDPSIAAAALGIGPNDLINDLNTMGFYFENMCIRDLRIYADLLDGQVYHYRDKNGLECDAVIHLRNGKYALVEIKLGSDKGIKEGINSLLTLRDKIDTNKTNKPSFLMVLTGTGQYAYKEEHGVNIVPITTLKP